MDKVAVLGAGSWGTAAAVLVAKKGYPVCLWGRDPELASRAEEERRNPRYLPEVVFPGGLRATSDGEEALSHAETVVVAVPSQAVAEILRDLRAHVAPGVPVVSLTKGLEISTLRRMTEVIADELEMPDRLVAALSGPNHAEEVSRDVPSATVIASSDQELARRLQELFMTPYFRVYTNEDVIGVELAGAFKNIIALAAGISDGLGYGDNTKASLLTRGLAEMTRLGVLRGADPFTFSGLAGVGDLVVTCFSRHSRNRLVGEQLGKGATLEEAVSGMRMIAEGVATVRAVRRLADEEGVELPIASQVHAVLYEGKRPFDCVSDLMLRGPTGEAVTESLRKDPVSMDGVL